jgi:hypothetical protein
VGAAVLGGGRVEALAGGPVRMGRAELLVVPMPVGSVPAGERGQRPAAGLVPYLSRSGVGRQLQASLLPVLLVLEVVATGQFG